VKPGRSRHCNRDPPAVSEVRNSVAANPSDHGTHDPEEVALDAGRCAIASHPFRVRRLLLARHAATSATRRAAFPADEDLDERGRADAARLATAVPTGCEAWCSPARRCTQTADAAGLAVRTEPLLAECDFGAWAGRSLEEIWEQAPAEAESWMTDPDARPHGGESLRDLAGRVRGWLDGQRAQDGFAVAITHGGVIKASVIAALESPVDAFWRVDVAPLAITELHAHGERWTLTRVNCRRWGEAAA
jgi:broad specificity phosphatase PhoE